MSKTPLKGAGREVRALVEEFSDRLLGEEEACFRRMDTAFRSGIGDLPRDIQSRLARVGGTPSRLTSERPLQNRILRGQQQAAQAAGEHVRRLVEDAEGLAYQSIGKELRVCERALGRAYQGLATKAVEAAQKQGASLVDASAQDYAAEATAAIGRFRTQMLAQMRGSAPDDLLLRLFFEEKVRGVRGFTSRGVWWWTPTDLKAVARRWAIEAGNTARLNAMRQFNEIGRDLGAA